jgi:hypothetical protein
MGIYDKITSRVKEQDTQFQNMCEQIEDSFASLILSSGEDVSTEALAKVVADSIEIKMAEMGNRAFEIFLERVISSPRLLDKFQKKTALTIYKGDLMTVARAATIPPKPKDK